MRKKKLRGVLDLESRGVLCILNLCSCSIKIEEFFKFWSQIENILTKFS